MGIVALTLVLLAMRAPLSTYTSGLGK
jgi:hypothetical protein